MKKEEKYIRPFTVKIYNEDGYRLNITHPSFKGRIRNRIGEGHEEKHETLIMHVKFELERYFLTEEITKEAVKNFTAQYINLNFNGNASIFDYFDEFITEKKNTRNEKTENLLDKASIRIYERSSQYFRKYLLKYNIRPYPNLITKKVLDNYYYDLRLANNYKVQLHKKIKAFIKYLDTEKGIAVHPSYKNSNFTETYDNQEPKEEDSALTKDELEILLQFRENLNSKNYKLKPYKECKTIKAELQLYQQNTKLKNLRLSLDCFLFMCATGQYHADITKKKLTLKTTKKNTIHCSYRRAKNNSKCIGISLENKGLFIAKDLMIKYKIKNNENFPYPLTLNTLDKHLREISALAELEIILRSKMGRKTFATRLYYDYNLDIKYIQKLLGHSSIKHTYNYLRITDDDVADKIADVLNKN